MGETATLEKAQTVISKPYKASGLDKVSYQERELWTEYFSSERSRDSRNELVKHYGSLVKIIASSIHGKLPERIRIDDLVSDGTMGLMDAIPRYNPDKGYKPNTFLQGRIRGEILDKLRESDWVPRLTRARSTGYKTAKGVLYSELGRTPTRKEIAEEMITQEKGAKTIKITSMKRFLHAESEGDFSPAPMRSIEDYRVEKENGESMECSIKNTSAETPGRVFEEKDFFNGHLKGFTPEEQFIINCYYRKESTMGEIGMMLNLTESRISQMHTSIIARLKAIIPNPSQV